MDIVDLSSDYDDESHEYIDFSWDSDGEDEEQLAEESMADYDSRSFEPVDFSYDSDTLTDFDVPEI